MFGDALRGNSATVVLEAQTGEFNAKIEQAERQWRESVGQMSREALKLDLAQERLKKSLAGYGAESSQAKRATIALRDAEESAGRAASGTSRQLNRQRGELDRLGRGALFGSGAFRSMGRSILYASSTLLGGAGFVFALRAVVHAAESWQVAQGKIQVALHNSGLSWAANSKQINTALEAQVRMTAFNRTDLANSLTALITRTGDVTEALRLNALAADVARGRNVDLDAAVKLVTRASIGQVGSLRRLGIDVQKVTTAEDAYRAAGVKATFQEEKLAKARDAQATKLRVIALLEQKYGGFAEKYAHSAEGAQARFNATLHESEIIIGNALLPILTHYLQKGSDWLEQMNKSGKLQKDVNDALRVGQQVVRGFAGAISVLKTVLGPVVHLLGGTEQAVKDLLEAVAVYKIAKIAVSIRSMGLAFGFVGRSAAAAAVTTTTAETAIGAGAIGAAGKVGILARALAGLPAGALVAGVAVGGIFAYPRGKQLGQAAAHKLFSALGLEHKPQQFSDLLRKAHSGTISLQQIAKARADGDITQNQMDALVYILNAVQARKGLGLPVPPLSELERDYVKSQADAGRSTAGGTGGRGGRGGARAGGRSETDIQLDIARASAKRDTASQLRYLNELERFYKAQAAALEAHKHKTEIQKQRLQQLYGEIDSTESQIQSIKSDAAQKAAATKRTEAAKLKKQQAAVLAGVEQKEQKLVDAYDRAKKTEQLSDDRKRLLALRRFYAQQAQNDALSLKERQRFAEKRRKVQDALNALPHKALEQRLQSREEILKNRLLAAKLTAQAVDDQKAYAALIAFYRRASRDMDLTARERRAYRRKMLETERQAQDKTAGAGSSKKQFEQMAFEFLSSLQGTLNTYGGNLFGAGDLQVQGGVAGSHAVIHTELLRKQNKILTHLANKARMPGARYGYTNLTESFDGYAT